MEQKQLSGFEEQSITGAYGRDGSLTEGESAAAYCISPLHVGLRADRLYVFVFSQLSIYRRLSWNYPTD